MFTITPCEILGPEWEWEQEISPDNNVLRLKLNGRLYVGRVPRTCRVFCYAYWRELHGHEMIPERVEGSIDEIKRIIEMRVATGVY